MSTIQDNFENWRNFQIGALKNFQQAQDENNFCWEVGLLFSKNFKRAKIVCKNISSVWKIKFIFICLNKIFSSAIYKFYLWDNVVSILKGFLQKFVCKQAGTLGFSASSPIFSHLGPHSNLIWKTWWDMPNYLKTI